MISELLNDNEMSKYDCWYSTLDDSTLCAVYFKWKNNKTRIKNGIAPKGIEELSNLDKLPKGVFIDSETGLKMIRTESGLEEYID